ncbi:MAG: DUF2207 domain-containing protein [Balneolaceae bacterium]|nr:DUF2207 domain-containing protein [Balneolaceae bacterium]MCH8547979.1 DUF2207 domain-containing protein [Balneolaceae bacterium]
MLKAALTSLIFFFLFLPEGNASDYTIPIIKVEAQVGADGVITIHEHRTYVYDGSFSWADYKFPRDGFDEIRNIRVSEGDQDFINDESEEPGTFSVSKSSGSVTIKWHYSAQDTSRTFTISYELEGALTVGPEWSELFWTWAASGRERSTEELEVSIELPEPVPTDSLHSWIRSPLTGVTVTKENGRFVITGEDISRSESVRTRAVFPSSIFETDVAVNEPMMALDRVVEEETQIEQERVEQEARKAFYGSFATEAAVAAVLLSIITFIVIYRRYGQRHKVTTVSRRETVLIPGHTPPAFVGRLLYHNYASYNHLTATILDLARRGWFKIEETKKGEDTWYSSSETDFKIIRTDQNPESDLYEWEKELISYLEEQIGKGRDSFKEIFSSTKSGITKFYQKWNGLVAKSIQKLNWKDSESYKGVIFNVVIQLILLIPLIWILVMSGALQVIIALIIVGLMSISSFAMIRRTPEGEEAYIRWNNYKDGLTNANQHTLRMEMLDRHFIYATALQLSEGQINKLIKPHEDQFVQYFPWLFLMAGSSSTPASAASSFSTLASSGSSSFGGSVSGGGASMGSAGGGASGGAG